MKKKILSLMLASTMMSSLLYTTASAITMYTPDGRIAAVMESDVEAWKAVGWYDVPVTTVYAPDGRTSVIATSEVAAWKAVGWYDVPVSTMYTPDGKTAVVATYEIDILKSKGWYDIPVSTVYALDGRTAVVATSEVEAWKAVGWYDKNYIVMYAPDGRTANVLFADIAAWKAVGWYDVPVSTVYAPDGRTAVIATSEVEAWKAVGWYDKNYVTMYSPDGRTVKVPLNNVSAWKAVGWYEYPISTQPSYTIDNTDTTEKGSLVNPYLPTEGTVVTHQKWSNESAKNISVICKQVMRGDTANKLAASENMFNTVPEAGQEWCFIEFDINYISSSNGINDSLKASDIIYADTFFTSIGDNIAIYDMAIHGKSLDGYSVFDNEFYPGSSGTVIIGLLIDSSVSDILLRIPNKSQNTNSWIKCN